MVRSVMFTVSTVMLSLVAVVPAALAQTDGRLAPSERTSPSNVTAATAAPWKSLRENLSSRRLPPEERIAAVDAWIKANPNAVSPAQPSESSRVVGQNAERRPTPVFNSGDPALDATETAIAAEMNPALFDKIAPEERIRQIDAALHRTRQLRESRDEKLRDRAIREAKSARPSSFNEAPKIAFPNTPAGRAEAKLHTKTAELREQTKHLTAEQRIAAVDAALPEIRRLEQELDLTQRNSLTKDRSSPNAHAPSSLTRIKPTQNR